MFSRVTNINTTNNTELAVTDKNSFFEVEVTSVSYQPLENNKKIAIINGTINVVIPAGLEGVFRKLETYKIFYNLDTANQLNFIALIRK